LSECIDEFELILMETKQAYDTNLVTY